MKNNHLTLQIRRVMPFIRILCLIHISLFTIHSSYAHTHSLFFESPLEGRWDLTLYRSGKTLPSWLEVRHSGTRTLVGQFVGMGGSARPISKVNFTNNTVRFSIPPQWDTASNDLVFEAIYQGDSLKGTLVMPDKTEYTLTGVRAPSLWRTKEPVWGKEIKLFDGTTMNGWHATGKNQWIVDSGMLRNPGSGSNMMTDGVYKDFKLHIEFRIPAGSNSGVYLRGRYEIQIVDSKGQEPAVGLLGAIYGFIAPLEMTAKSPGEWQSFDVVLVGRLVTLSVNGTMVICKQIIPGITGGAINSQEGEPGPIYIQGDHGAIDLRNIRLTPAE